jgi:aminoglycoside N3'-acetyltransferase
VERNSTVVIMADVTRLAWRARRAGQRFNGADFLDGFVKAVGQGGTVLVPTFNFDLQNGDAFDVHRTRSISGALAQLALGHASFQRTGHPLHSFGVAGAAAPGLIATTPLSSFDRTSPFGLMHRQGAVLYGIDLPLDDLLTFAHYVEEQETVAYRRFSDLWIHHTDRNGTTQRRRFVRYTKKAGHINRFTPLESALIASGSLTYLKVAGSRVARIELAKAYDVIAGDIRTNGARGIHAFSWDLWLRDVVKGMLRIFGIRTTKERTAHAARTS